MNNGDNRRERIKELKIKSKRNSICKTWNSVINCLGADSFISIEDTIRISEEVYNKIDTLPNQEKINIDVEPNLNKVANLEKIFKIFFYENAILLHHEDRECGAIRIKVEDFFKYLGDIAEFSKFKEGYSDLVLVDENLKYGICVERYEYFNKLFVWY
ncbi:YxiF family protein [Terrisporobacter vanillatitrophus]|uniref:YxiF family protein n=1 Tax=Terrisporobacter vanillatitrophus TaxID=3058402 RepID=UPI003365EF2C